MKNKINNLPHLNGKKFLTDGGLETTMIFQKGIELPHFASFDLLSTLEGKNILEDYYLDYLNISQDHNFGFILESPTYRASSDWGYLLGYDRPSLDKINEEAIRLLIDLRAKYENEESPILISGCIGPRGDGYALDRIMSIEESKAYHSEQILSLARSGSDLITAFTINYSDEAIGIAMAAKDIEVPAVIGFTVETNGSLSSGETIKEAIEKVDLSTNNYPAYYMINCAHPTHFKSVLKGDDKWKERIMAIRANASTKSHAELNESEYLDAGDSCDLAHQYEELNELLPNLKVIGGCCGTNHAHITEICKHFSVIV